MWEKQKICFLFTGDHDFLGHALDTVCAKKIEHFLQFFAIIQALCRISFFPIVLHFCVQNICILRIFCFFHISNFL
jgi:hypothetical protein